MRRSWFIKRQVVLEYLEGKKSMMTLSRQYDIPNQSISRWVQDYSRDIEKRKVHILDAMTEEERKQYDALKLDNELLKKALEQKQTLEQANDALKKDLEFAQMRARAMEIIIDLAKEEYSIDLRKNSGARQSAKSKKTTRRQP